MFRQLFEEGLELQKVRLREQRAYAREQRQEQQQRYQDHVTSLENYYKDQVGFAFCSFKLTVTVQSNINLTVFVQQFSILKKKLAQERQEVQFQKKAQEKVQAFKVSWSVSFQNMVPLFWSKMKHV